VRKNIDLHPKTSLRDLIDMATNQRLARPLYTSVTALAAVQSFAIAMVFGTVIAAGSSVLVAAAILLFPSDRRARRAPTEASEAPTLQSTP
jgi:preprotein translocase subunit SecF